MPKRLRIPFQGLDPYAWRKLGITAVLVLFLFNFLMSLLNLGVLNGVGSDYLSYWSAGKAAQEFGFENIYDLEVLDELQFKALNFLNITRDTFTPIIAPYPAFFLIPFRFLALIDPRVGYWIWTTLNILLFAGYTVFYTRKVLRENKLDRGQMILIFSSLVAYPIYSNFVVGQVGVLLFICTGEFVRNAMEKRPVLAGLWLGGLLVKPQILLLILPAFLIMRYWKVLWGFFLSGLGIASISIVLVGFKATRAMIELWMFQSPGYTPGAMANWRMLGINLGGWINEGSGWAVVLVGMLITFILWLRVCLFAPVPGTDGWSKVYFAIFALSCAFTWHSHIHMGIVLLPFLILFVVTKSNDQDAAIFDYWTFSYAIAFALSWILSFLIKTGALPHIENLDDFIFGAIGLSLYLFVAIRMLRQFKKA